jgi:hypothetical protein
MKLEPALDPRNSGEWVLVDDTPDFRRYELELDDGNVIRRTEHKHTAQMLDENQRQANDSLGQRFGDGKIVGRVPLNVYYASGLAEATREKDTKWIKRFWNDGDNRRFRTFRGNV